ncbi:hypothetical protein NHH03_05980 [Stieleria sp. TO1_6]|uniref:hypothetical protein n=1 Tax=Stieleria tagensis TaxID=2956795 RepID=UPI00209BB889|nr:hypothetical protein [Stieleria tagensis]MCO8121279.1 hypothetical protein [Stieleria tagensis]
MSNRSTSSIHAVGFLLFVAGCTAWPPAAAAEPPPGADCNAAELLPQTIVACAEFSGVRGSLKTVLNHPLRSKLEAMDAYRVLMESDATQQLRVGIGVFETSMGQPWQDALATLTDRGITVALDSVDGGLAILVQSSDADLLERFRGFVLALRQLQGAAVRQGDYRGFNAELVGDKLRMVRMHDWLLLTNNAELGKSIIDQYIDRDSDSLQTNATYANAAKELSASESDGRLVSAFLDVNRLRDAGVAKDVFKEKVDNVVAEMLLGGVLSNLRQTHYATAQLHLSGDSLALQLATPHQRDWEPPREYFFGAPGLATAPPLLAMPNQLFALSTHRDLSQMWLRSGDLLSDQASEQLVVADTTLTTIFSGRDFGEDILGSLKSDVQIVGIAQEFTDILPRPAIKLPAFALQFRMKNPAQTQPDLRRVFQSFVGFLNVVGAQNGQPQLDLGMETVGDAQLITSRYLPDRDERERLDAPIQFNFSPTLAFAGDRFIVSSSTALARALVESKDDPPGTITSGLNTRAEIEAGVLQDILQANRSQLVANNMLEKGHSKEAAEGEIGLLLKLIEFFRDVHMNLLVSDSQMAINLIIDVKSDVEAQP